MAKRIFGQVGRLLPQKADDYTRLHLTAWPELLAVLRRYHLENYSIFLSGLEVFSYFEYTGADYAADMTALSAEPVMQRWWVYSKPCFERYAMGPYDEFYADMRQVFYME